MQKCIKCGEKFNYLSVLFSIWNFKGYEILECDSCKTNYKITVLSRIIIGFSIGAQLIFNRYLFGLLDNIFKGYILYLVVLILISPLIVRFKEKLK